MATAEEYASWIVSNKDKKGTPQFETVSKAYQLARSQTTKEPEQEKPELTPSEQMRLGQEQYKKSVREANPVLSKVGDVASGATGIVRGGLNILSKPFMEEGLGEKLLPTDFVDKESGAYTAGSIADPAAWLIGLKGPQVLATGASKIPGAAKVTQALSKNMLGRASQRAATGGAIGGTIGGLSDDGSAKTGAEIGAISNVVLPPAISGVTRGVRSVKDYVMPSPGSLGVRAAGDKADDVIQALLKQRSEVPGVKLTAGQASVPANSAEFAALQKVVSTKDPSAYFGPQGIQGQQEAARLASLRTIGKTPQELESALASRSATAAKNYGQAFNQAIKGDPDLMNMWKNPYFKDALPDAIKLAEAKGITPKNNLTEFLHYVKVSLDKQLLKSGDTALGATEKDVVTNLQKQLVKWLGNKNPAYDTARLEHIALSKPINQMKLGQEVERALVAPVSEAERASSFGTALRKSENTVSKATGRPRVEDLTPAQVKVVKAIEADLKRNADFKTLSTVGMKNLENRIGAPQSPPTGFFQPMVSAARSWLNRLLGTGHERALERLAPIMQDPQQMAVLMQAATPQQRKVIESLMSKYATTGTIIGGSQIEGDK